MLGLAGAFALTRLLSSALFDVNPNDPVTFVVVSVFLSAVALAACYLPARRATKVDPVVALSHD
jgi:ABC-type lipoprotein release transport system permease subunit